MEAEALEEIDEDELVRCRFLRGMNMRFTSSGFIWLRV